MIEISFLAHSFVSEYFSFGTFFQNSMVGTLLRLNPFTLCLLGVLVAPILQMLYPLFLVMKQDIGPDHDSIGQVTAKGAYREYFASGVKITETLNIFLKLFQTCNM